jgi:hypothetical protein
LQYQNTGKSPAFNMLQATVYQAFSLNEWKDGGAAKKISAVASQCFELDAHGTRTQVAYPNAGFASYMITVKTEDLSPKYVVTDALISGDEIFALQGCFGYKTVGELHHSSFCYFYQAKVTNLPAMNICTVGNDAD